MAYESLHESNDNSDKTVVSVGLFYFEERDENNVRNNVASRKPSSFTGEVLVLQQSSG